MEIKSAVKGLFDQLRFVLEQIDDQHYKTPSVSLSGATVGQHFRHSLEFFSCLVIGGDVGVVNYDKREREASLESHRYNALDFLAQLAEQIERIDCKQEVVLELSYSHTSDQPLKVQSNFGRELIYNIEHAVHHMALIKIGLREIGADLTIPEGFGVANSTIRYQRQSESSSS